MLDRLKARLARHLFDVQCSLNADNAYAVSGRMAIDQEITRQFRREIAALEKENEA